MEGGVSLSDFLVSQLATESDCRSLIGHDGFTKYNSTLKKNRIVPLGSCTASSLHNEDFEDLVKKLKDFDEDDLTSIETQRELWDGVRQDFVRILNINKDENWVVFVPSGTDAEALISSVILKSDGSDRLNNVVVAPLEVGSGTSFACGGKAFSEHSPDGSRWSIGDDIIPEISQKTVVYGVELRSSKGDISPMALLEGEINGIFRNSVEQHQSVAVHIVAGSKTGAHAPSSDFISRIEDVGYPRLHIIVDAAQGRFSRKGVNRSLKAGRIVSITGSKFFGAPPFCGAVIFPKSKYSNVMWSEEYSPLFNPMGFEISSPNLELDPRNGVLLRWMIGVSNMNKYYSTDPAYRLKVLKWFENDAVQIINGFESLHYMEPQFFSPDEENRLLATNKTIHTFQVSVGGTKLGYDELKSIHASLIDRNRFEGISLGQPVLLSSESGKSALRIALGSRLIVDTIKEIESEGSESSGRETLRLLVKNACQRIVQIAGN